jgi:hypothetical protein
VRLAEVGTEDVKFQPAFHRAAAPRQRRASREAGDATLLLSDAAGVRVVSVPKVIVGAQEIVPVSTAPAEDATGRVSL